jgi:cell division protein FtsB
VKLLAVLLAGLLALIQYPLWLGHGSWLRVWDLDRQLGLQQEVNAGKRMRNEGLEAEATDLRDGTLAVEERARYELGMVKQDEIFVQLNPAGSAGPGSLPRPIPAIPGPGAGAAPGAAQPPGPWTGSPPGDVPPRRSAGVVTVGR